MAQLEHSTESLPAVRGSPEAESGRVVVHGNSDDPRWIRFLVQRKPTLFQDPEWGAVIESVYGFPARVAMILRNGEVTGGLPYADVDDFRGRRRIANAFADVCEPIGEMAWPQIEDALCGDNIPWRIRSRARPSARAHESRKSGLHQVVDLRVTSAEAQARCDPKHRHDVRHALRQGLSCRRINDESAIDIFYQLHSRVRKDKHRLLPQPRAFIQEMVRRYFPERGFLIVATHGEAVLAAVLMLACGDTLYLKLAASDLNALELRPNHLLWWTAIQMAIEDGYAKLDLGISEEEGLARFKRRLGAEETPVYVAHYNRPDKTAAVRQVEDAFVRLTTALTEPEVPLNVTQTAGALLYRFFV